MLLNCIRWRQKAARGRRQRISDIAIIMAAPLKKTMKIFFISSRATRQRPLDALSVQGARNIVLTGVGYCAGYTGVVVQSDGMRRYYEHRRIPKGSHGTGDVYASAFTGAMLRGWSAYDAARIAADYTLLCIENTQGDENHWYGVKFEPLLPMYIKKLNR